MSDAVEQLTLFDLDTWSGKMCPEPSVPREAKTSGLSWRKLSELKLVPVQCLDLTPGVGNLLGQSYWEINSHWLGELWTLNYVRLNIIERPKRSKPRRIVLPICPQHIPSARSQV